MARFFTCIVLLTMMVAASPQVNYPLSLQYPPVARVGEPFSFQFAPTTFSSESESLQYSLTGNPFWLSFDANSRTLSGTPSASDVGTVTFSITAAGQAGAVANMESKLLVTTDTGPRTKSNLSLTLSAAGKLSGPTTVTLNPLTLFNISFPVDTFDSFGKKLSYVATLADHTPLPAWISFDATLIRFVGIAPSMESPQTFEILLIACETPGFASSSIPFTMIINKHSLFFNPFSQFINLTRGNEVHVTNIKEQLFYDDLPIPDNEIQSVSAKLPSWLTFDNGTFEIFGKPPSNAVSQNVTVTAQDWSGNTAEQTIHLIFKSELFVSDIGNFTLSIGENFEHRILPSILVDGNERLTADLTSLAEYLHFDPANLVISGTVPDDFLPQDVECSMTARSADGTREDVQPFFIKVQEAEHGAGATPWKTGDTDGTENLRHSPDGKKDAVIVGSVIGAICGVAFLSAFALCLRRRKKSIKSYINPNHPKSPRKSDISRPVFIPYAWPDIDEIVDHDVEKGKPDNDEFVDRAPEEPPKLDLHLEADSDDMQSLTDSIGDADTRILDTFDESSWGIQNDIAPSQHPHDSMKIPTEIAKRASQRSDTFRKHKRQTTTVYQDQIHRSTGLPVNRRITGLGQGQGRYTYFPTKSNTHFSRSSARRPLSMHSDTTTRCTSTCSTAPSAFPQPSTARKHTTMVTTPTEDRRSIRLVRSSLFDRRPIDERRNSYIRKRASAQSPFFSASTNASSSNYKSPPAFITEARSSPRVALSSITRNIVVRPDDSVVEEKEKDVSQSFRVEQSSNYELEVTKQDFPGSLRKNRTNRPLTAIAANRDRVEKSYARPRITVSSGSRTSYNRRDSTRHSLRAYDLKASLNDLTGSKIFEDTEMSDSVYSDEEKDIEEAEKRTTVKPGEYTLPPLNLGKVDTARNSKRESNAEKRKTKRDSKRELKRTSERDPTPYYARGNDEHGGKENVVSVYSLGQKGSPVRIESRGKARLVTSPDRTKSSIAGHSKTTTTETRRPQGTNTSRGSKTPSLGENTKERQSRRSIHSRSQSRQSSGLTVKRARDHSRTQSSAYPYFDPAVIESPGSSSSNKDNHRSSIGNAITTAADKVCLPESNTIPSLITRDLSGNLTFYGGDDDEPTIEELGSSSIGFRTSKGRISSTARQSRLASLHLSSQQVPQLPPKSSKRGTVIPVPSTHQTVATAEVSPQEVVKDGKLRDRAPLGELQGENGRAPEPEEQQAGQGRKTWGSLKTIIGRGSRWVSGDHWDKQGKEEKAFI